MSAFNEQELNKYFDDRDFYGAAEYLSSFPAKDAQSQIELNNRIRKLRKQGDIQTAYLSKVDTDGIEAYHFINGINGNGTIPHTRYDSNGNVIPNSSNSYGDAYNDFLNNLQCTDTESKFNGKRINAIRFELNAGYENQFANNLGIDDLQNNDLGIKYTINKDGKHVIEIPTNNKNLVRVYNAANDLITTYRTGTSVYQFKTNTPFEIKGVGNGFVASINGFNVYNLHSAVNLVDKANKKTKEDKEKVGEITINEEMYVSPFLGHGHANAYKSLQKGVISIDTYKKIVDERTEVYNRLLKQADLTQYDVYFSGGNLTKDKDGVMRQADNPNKRVIEQILSVAMNDKRVTYSAAMRGGEMGTYITIAADKDSKGNLSEGDAEQFMRIFIPGLFKSSCDEAFNADTKTMAAVDNADMKRWQYGKRLHDGTYVGYNNDIGHYTITKDDNGQEFKTPISEEDMLRFLNKEHILDGSVDRILAEIDNSKNVGNEVDMYALCEMAATVATNELYPPERYSRNTRIYQQQILYRELLNLLNSEIAREAKLKENNNNNGSK